MASAARNPRPEDSAGHRTDRCADQKSLEAWIVAVAAIAFDRRARVAAEKEPAERADRSSDDLPGDGTTVILGSRSTGGLVRCPIHLRAALEELAGFGSKIQFQAICRISTEGVRREQRPNRLHRNLGIPGVGAFVDRGRYREEGDDEQG